jgi:hypothetical protein
VSSPAPDCRSRPRTRNCGALGRLRGRRCDRLKPRQRDSKGIVRRCIGSLPAAALAQSLTPRMTLSRLLPEEAKRGRAIDTSVETGHRDRGASNRQSRNQAEGCCGSPPSDPASPQG